MSGLRTHRCHDEKMMMMMMTVIAMMVMMTMNIDDDDDVSQVSLWGGDAVFNNLDLRLEVKMKVLTTAMNFQC